MRRTVQIYTVPLPGRHSKDLDIAAEYLSPIIRKFILKILDQVRKRGKALKFQLCLQIEFVKFDFQPLAKDSDYKRDRAWFASKSLPVYSKSGIVEQISSAFEKITSSFEAFIHKGSGWRMVAISSVAVHISLCHSIKGGCGRRCSLPIWLRKKRATLSMECEDNRCFLYSIAASLTKVKSHPERVTHKVYADIISKLPSHLIEFPTKIKCIEKFEKQSPISICVFTVEDSSKHIVYPVYVSKCVEKKFHANLMLYKGHFYPITNMSALLSNQCKSNRHKTFICNFCLSYFTSQERLRLHSELCQRDGQRYKFPSGACASMKFENYKNNVICPFVIYLDTESLSLPPTPSTRAKTISSSKHKAISVAAVTICRSNPTLNSKLYCYTGLDCIERFLVEFLQVEIRRIDDLLLNYNAPMLITQEEEQRHEATLQCEFCSKTFNTDNKKCRDHCHLSGRFRFTLCNNCNLTHASSHSNKVPVFAHGMSNYDSHLFVQKFHLFPDVPVRVIAKSGEQYLAIFFGDTHFKDSCNFLKASLATLASNLDEKGRENFQYLRMYVRDKEKRDIMFQKGELPYSYMTSESVLEERQLPGRDAFYNELTDTAISEESYHHALKVWQLFKCETLKDYMEIYEKTDVLLLVDIFESFRTTMIREYALDPAHYLSLPQMSLDCFLKTSGCTLSLLTEVDMYLFFLGAIRGGISQISRRHAQANNPYLPDFDPSKKTSYIMYFDMTNLYGHCMRQCLPVGEFSWMDESQLDLQSILSIKQDSDYGCIVQVDLQYPSELHDMHRDLPLAPERMIVPNECLSPYAVHLKEKLEQKGSDTSSKLFTTLHDKQDYILHYRLLQFYVKLGLRVVNVKRGILFRQAPVVRAYIDFNSKKRSEATNEFDADFPKLMNNSLYGKFNEKPKNRMNVKLVSNQRKCEAEIAKMTFKSARIINKNLVALIMRLPVLQVRKPIFMGQVILDLAKIYLYQFHYCYIKKKYGEAAELLMTDTDSLMYLIHTEDVYEDLLPDRDSHFDFSNYPPDHVLYSTKNKKVPGFWKDEAPALQIDEFCGLRSKMYVLKVDRRALKTAKGVKKYVINSKITFDDYKSCLFNETSMEHEFFSITSRNQQLYTDYQRKASLSPFDNKRYLLNDGITSLPYGHYKICDN